MITIVIDEEEPFTYRTVLRDAAGSPLPAPQLFMLRLTLYVVDTGTVLNDRNAQNINNANDCSVNATNGLLTWQAQSADNVVVSTVVPLYHYEHHQALFQWSTIAGGDSNVSKHLVDIFVRHLAFVS